MFNKPDSGNLFRFQYHQDSIKIRFSLPFGLFYFNWYFYVIYAQHADSGSLMDRFSELSHLLQ